MSDESGHEVVRIDLADLTRSQQDALRLQLGLADIFHVFAGAGVSVSSLDELAVRELIVEVCAVIGDDRPAQVRPFRRMTSDGRLVAGRTRRLGGAFVDYLVLGLSLILLTKVNAPFSVRLLVDAAYFIVPTWLAGRTLGKLIAGTRVLGAARSSPPLLSEAAIRWAVPAIIELGYFVGSARAIALLLVVARIVVYAPVLWDADGRGLHDRAAGTTVVRA